LLDSLLQEKFKITKWLEELAVLLIVTHGGGRGH